MQNNLNGDRVARLEIVAAGAVLHHNRVILPGEGNLSMRLGDGAYMITPTGCDKGCLEARDLIRVREGDAENSERVSSEFCVHLEVYRRRPEVMAVVHAHPSKVQGLAAMGESPDCGLLLEAETLLGSISRAAGHEPGSDELAAAVARGIGGSDVCIMERHGAIAVASTMKMAVLRMLLLERLAGLTLATSR